jgi:hypothetical protein
MTQDIKDSIRIWKSTLYMLEIRYAFIDSHLKNKHLP